MATLYQNLWRHQRDILNGLRKKEATAEANYYDNVGNVNLWWLYWQARVAAWNVEDGMRVLEEKEDYYNNLLLINAKGQEAFDSLQERLLRSTNSGGGND